MESIQEAVETRSGGGRMSERFRQCFILPPSHLRPFKDGCDCVLQLGHSGPHRFVDEGGKVIEWETDNECDCESCQSDDARNWCVVWNEVDGSELVANDERDSNGRE